MFKKLFLHVLAAGLGAGGLISSLSAQELRLEKRWALEPDQDRPYLTTDHNQRGMDYNPVTGHLVMVNRAGGLSVPILDATDGSEVGFMSTDGVSGGLFVLNKIVVADDGVIYAANMTTDTIGSAGPLKIYRWTDEDANPEVIYEGDPTGGSDETAQRRFGDTLLVRGTETDGDLEIFTAGWLRTGVARFTPGQDGQLEVDYTLLGADYNGQTRTVGFGPGDLFYATHPGQPLHEFSHDPVNHTFELERTFDGSIISSGIGPLGWGEERNWLGGINTYTGNDSGNHHIQVYLQGHLTTQWTVLPALTYTLETTNPNGNGVGSLVILEDSIYALVTNNGLVALDVVEGEPDPIPVGDIYWTNQTEIRTAELDGSNPRTVLAGLTRAIGIAVDPARRQLYYTDDGAGTVGRVNLDGTGNTVLLSGRSNPQFIKVHDGRIYWAEWNHGLLSADLNGEDIQDVIVLGSDRQSTAVLIGPDGEIYLGTAGDPAAGANQGRLWRATGDPAAPEEVHELRPSTYGVVFEPNGERIFATAFAPTSEIYSLDMASGNHTWMFYDVQPLGVDLTRDGTQLIWAERTEGAIRIANVDGSGSVASLVTGEASPFGVLVLPELPDLENYDAWIARFDLPADQRGPEDDPDGDGIKNLLEYAFGGDPTVARSAPLPAVGFESSGDNDYLALGVTKNPEATGVIYTVEVSSNLVDWNSGPEHTTVIEETETHLLVRDNLPLETESRRFVRVRVVNE